MVTSKKTAKPAAKTAAKPAAKPAEKSGVGALPGLGDLSQLVKNFKVPGIDIAAIVEAQRKDMEALAEANRLAYEGIKSLAERRNELLRESLAEWQEMMKTGIGPDALPKQTELVRKRVQNAMKNMRELAEMEAANRNKAWKVMQDRFQENLSNLQKLLQPK